MSEGNIVAWHKKEGEKINAGDMLCEVQTDKAVVAMDADDDGVMAKIFLPAGSENIQVGTAIAVIAEEDENWEEVARSAKDPSESASITRTKDLHKNEPTAELDSKIETKQTSSNNSTTLLGPAARFLIDQHNLDVSEITSSGPHNIVLKSDVLSYMKTRKSTKISEPIINDFTNIPITSMRRTIAKRLGESKSSIPHLYTRATFQIDKLNSLRNALKSAGIRISINDLVVKACGFALLANPQLNATGKVVDDQLILQMQPNVDICVAVATQAGLITPIVKNAAQMPVTDINQVIKSLSMKAKDNKLQPDEFSGGGFTISNLGMYGIREFTAIINLPQVAILAVGGGIEVLNPDSFEIQTQMTITLSSDARFIDEVSAGNFLRHVANLLSHSPRTLIEDDLKARPYISLKYDGPQDQIAHDQFHIEQLQGLN